MIEDKWIIVSVVKVLNFMSDKILVVVEIVPNKEWRVLWIPKWTIRDNPYTKFKSNFNMEVNHQFAVIHQLVKESNCGTQQMGPCTSGPDCQGERESVSD